MVKPKEKKKYVNVTTPIGVGSWLYLIKPDIGRENSSNKFSAELYVPEATFMRDGKEMVATVLQTAREFFNDKKLNLKDIKSPFQKMDDLPDDKVQPWQKGTFRIRARAGRLNPPMQESEWDQFRPTIISPQKNADGKFEIFDMDEVKNVKAGDYLRFICSVYGYTNKGGGVALGLNFVQFVKEGKALGQGRMKQLEKLDEIEVTVDDVDDMEDAADAQEAAEAPEKTAAPAVVKKGGKKAVVKKTEPEDEEDSESGDDADPMLQFG